MTLQCQGDQEKHFPWKPWDAVVEGQCSPADLLKHQTGKQPVWRQEFSGWASRGA